MNNWQAAVYRPHFIETVTVKVVTIIWEVRKHDRLEPETSQCQITRDNFAETEFLVTSIPLLGL